MNSKKIKKLIIYNSLLFASFLSLVEIVLGKWYLINTPVTKIPAAAFSRKIYRDVRKIYGLDNPYYISNKRDDKGYRTSQEYTEKDIVLTIGGSTTASIFVDDNNTWQNILSKNLDDKFAVLNGGVSGQSSFGHLYAIDQWHSKALPIDKVKFIIYYFGINDRNLLEVVPTFEEYESDAYANDRFWKIKSFLIKYSFFYSKLAELRNIYFQNQLDSDVFYGYQNKTERFTDLAKTINLKKIDYKSNNQYIDLIKKLDKKTKALFPNASIYWVQEPLPGCNFLSPKIIQNYYSSDFDICEKVAKIYLLQDYALDKIRINTNIIKMYLDNPLTKNATYDIMHANETGNRTIANYLYENIFSKKYEY